MEFRKTKNDSKMVGQAERVINIFLRLSANAKLLFN